jgi:hypothetical protein
LMFDFIGNDVPRGQVIKRVKGEDGQPIGKRYVNPILDSRMYTIQLSDGLHHELSANIAENLMNTNSSSFKRLLDTGLMKNMQMICQLRQVLISTYQRQQKAGKFR